MEITFVLSHEFSQGSTPEENAYALKVLLGTLIYLDIGYLRNNPGVPPLYASGVRYQRTRNWLTTETMYRHRFGDCKSLAASLIAERWIRDGVKCRPVFRDLRRIDGLLDFHILVQTPEGDFEDPSKVCGMAMYKRQHQTDRE